MVAVICFLFNFRQCRKKHILITLSHLFQMKIIFLFFACTILLSFWEAKKELFFTIFRDLNGISSKNRRFSLSQLVLLFFVGQSFDIHTIDIKLKWPLTHKTLNTLTQKHKFLVPKKNSFLCRMGITEM